MGENISSLAKTLATNENLGTVLDSIIYQLDTAICSTARGERTMVDPRLETVTDVEIPHFDRNQLRKFVEDAAVDIDSVGADAHLTGRTKLVCDQSCLY